MTNLTTKAATWGAIALSGFSMPSNAAVYADGTDLNQAKSRALPYVAANGGPAVTVETYKSDGTLLGFFSGSLLTSPDGQNRTVVTAGHGILQARAVDPNAYAVVVCGTNRFTDRGLEIRASNILLAPGCDGTLNTLDLAALSLPMSVPNTGRFAIGQAGLGALLTSTGVGFVLTQSQGRNGTYAPRDGSYARFDGWATGDAWGGSNDTYFNTGIFEVGQYPYGGVCATGDSGSGAFLASSFQFDENGRITHGTYVGTNEGWGGDRLSSASGTLYIDPSNPTTLQFLTEAIAVPKAMHLASSVTNSQITISVLDGTPNIAVTLQSSPDLASWTNCASVTLNSSGIGSYTEQVTAERKFFRAKMPE